MWSKCFNYVSFFSGFSGAKNQTLCGAYQEKSNSFSAKSCQSNEYFVCSFGKQIKLNQSKHSLIFLVSVLELETINECEEYQRFLQVSDTSDPEKCAESCVDALHNTKFIVLTTLPECYCSPTKPSKHCSFSNGQVYQLRRMQKFVLWIWAWYLFCFVCVVIAHRKLC